MEKVLQLSKSTHSAHVSFPHFPAFSYCEAKKGREKSKPKQARMEVKGSRAG